MELKQIMAFIETEDRRLIDYYTKSGKVFDQEKVILARTVKLTEEFGELCDEVLAHCAFQRKEKLEGRDGKNLSEEFADVIFVTLLLAKAMEVDVERAMERKIEKVNKRYG